MISVDIKLHKADFSLAAAFSLPSTGVTGIYGPSGCGKTSLLRSLAGLEPDMTGSVELNGEAWHSSKVSVPIEKRRIGIVFQETSLFSHLSVEGNLRFAQRRAAPGSQTYSLSQVAQLLQIEALLERRIDKLSGGERQRVAIGRALMAAPQLLVMDEPLSALDIDARLHLMHILEKVFQELEIPVLYVSHASDEIARLADNLVVLEAGEVTAYGPIKEVLGQVDSALSRADDAFCVLQCRVSAHDRPHLSSVISNGGAVLYIPRVDLAERSAVRLRIRARDVSLCLERPQRSSILNILEARVVQISECLEQGSRILKLDLCGETLLARVSEYSVEQLGLHEEQKLYAQIKSAALVT